MVTSIPPHQRVKVDNLIVAGLWHGPTKPEIDSILEPILERISDLNINGILHSEIIIRPKLLMVVFDLPAKSSATNTKQFNGEYGCLYCLDKGEIAHNKRARIYPPTAEHLLRTLEQMKQWASMATDGKADAHCFICVWSEGW